MYRYRNIVRRLIMCYDQMVQTQKRELIKKMLDCAIGRMLEYKKEIVKLDNTDYQYVFFVAHLVISNYKEILSTDGLTIF